MRILPAVLVSRMAMARAARTVTRLFSGRVVPGALQRLAQDRVVFNVYEGLEMHGERG
jgi:hypothetical protein